MATAPPGGVVEDRSRSAPSSRARLFSVVGADPLLSLAGVLIATFCDNRESAGKIGETSPAGPAQPPPRSRSKAAA